MEKILKAWLRKSQLTDESENYTALVAGSGSIGVMNIIEQMLYEDMSLKKDTIVDIISRFNHKSAELVLSGYNVNTGLVYMRPVINDKFHDKTWSPDINSVYISFTQGHDLRQALGETTIEVLGEQINPIEIYSMTDLSTGNTEGKLEKGSMVEVIGTNLKVLGVYPECGIVFRNVQTQEITKLKRSEVVVNEQSKLKILIPGSLETGEYEMTLCTQYKSDNKLFNQPRYTAFEKPIIID